MTLWKSAKPTIAKVHGAAVMDISLEDAAQAFDELLTEVRHKS